MRVSSVPLELFQMWPRAQGVSQKPQQVVRWVISGGWSLENPGWWRTCLQYLRGPCDPSVWLQWAELGRVVDVTVWPISAHCKDCPPRAELCSVGGELGSQRLGDPLARMCPGDRVLVTPFISELPPESLCLAWSTAAVVPPSLPPSILPSFLAWGSLVPCCCAHWGRHSLRQLLKGTTVRQICPVLSVPAVTLPQPADPLSWAAGRWAMTVPRLTALALAPQLMPQTHLPTFQYGLSELGFGPERGGLGMRRRRDVLGGECPLMGGFPAGSWLSPRLKES